MPHFDEIYKISLQELGIPDVQERHPIIIDGILNNELRIKILVDTGASVTLVKKDLVERFRLKKMKGAH